MAMFMRSSLLIAGLWAVGSNAGSSGALSQVNQSFVGYMQAFGKNYANDSVEYLMREKIFNERLAEILAHNAAGLSWKMGLNHLTDYTEGELQGLRGFKRAHKGDGLVGGTSIMQIGGDIDQGEASKGQSCSNVRSCTHGLICGAQAVCVKPSGGTETLDWTAQTHTSMEILSQGACGSCWAVAAAAAVQFGAELAFPKFNKVLSPENINKCAPNPMECGGQGGCKGSTPGLAFEYLKSIQGSGGGITTIDQTPYTARSGDKIPEDSCKAGALSFLQVKNLRARAPLPGTVSIGDYIKVKDNHAEQVMNALVSVGPLAVAIVGSGIQGYSSGVLNGCKSAVVDHAVVMMGFGNDPTIGQSGMKYWKIRNSWGKHWGENGFLRLRRRYAQGAELGGDPMKDDVFQGEKCAWDMEPDKGVACKDEHGKYPTKTRVCGECGIVSDVAYPTGISVHSSLLDA